MWRDIFASLCGHIVVFGGVILSSLFNVKSPAAPTLTIHRITTVTPQQIQSLLAKSSARTEQKTIVPQVQIKPDEQLPNQTRRRKQTVKRIEPDSNQKSGEQKQGSPVQGIKTDTEFEYPDYLIEMRDRIFNNWRYPNLRKSLTTTVYFRIAKEGHILSIKVEKPSGNISYDSSAWDAIQKSNPFGPLPEGYSNDKLGIHFTFIYEH
jgi:TonB family protein